MGKNHCPSPVLATLCDLFFKFTGYCHYYLILLNCSQHQAFALCLAVKVLDNLIFFLDSNFRETILQKDALGVGRNGTETFITDID